jgi:hypothetical protein
MDQARLNIFDSTLGVRGEKSWLDSKVMRRELTQDLQRDALSQRKEKATEAAESFRDGMSKRAEMRNGLEQRAKESKSHYEELLKRKADEYREKLRSKLRPDVWS